MKRIFALAAAGTALCSVPAMAQDTQATFSGPRVEGIIGLDMSKSGSTVDNDTTRDLDQSIDGLLYGVGVGFDIAAGGSLVIGAEAEYTDSTAKVENAGTAALFNLGRVETGRDIYVGGRIGVIAGSNMLIYAKGGYTNARFNLVGTDGTVSLDQRLDTDGWRIGAGLEHAMSENSYVKLEYRYSNYGEGEFDFDGQSPDSSRFNIDTDRHQVVAAIGLRF